MDEDSKESSEKETKRDEPTDGSSGFALDFGEQAEPRLSGCGDRRRTSPRPPRSRLRPPCK